MAETRAVAKAILVADNNILILRRSDTDTRRPLQWDLPGGAIDRGEDIKQACVREVKEETGITVRAADLKTIYAMTELVDDAISATFMFFTVSVPLTEAVLSSEHIEARWVSLEQTLSLFTYQRHLEVLEYMKQYDLLQANHSD